MKKLIILYSMFLAGCVQKTQTYPPVGGFLSQKDLNSSRNRAKNLNDGERKQIEFWIRQQNENFYPMSLNYWVNIPDLLQGTQKCNGENISYKYDLFDFDGVKLYSQPKKNINVQFGHFEELKAIEDVLRYLPKNAEATLLVPSVLAFGTYGDNEKIPNDMPLIIKIKVL